MNERTDMRTAGVDRRKLKILEEDLARARIRQKALDASLEEARAAARELERLLAAERDRSEQLQRTVTLLSEQQRATREILGLINRSHGDAAPVFQAIIEEVAHLCRSEHVRMYLKDGEDTFRMAALCGNTAAIEGLEVGVSVSMDRRGTVTLAIKEGRTVRIDDTIDLQARATFPQAVAAWKALGARAQVCVPLLRNGAAVGCISSTRSEATPFSDHEVKLLETFAQFAVIAIESVRLVRESSR